jgi:hypothetical protein
MPDVLVCAWRRPGTPASTRGGAKMIFIFISIMLMFLLGLVALYLYNSGVFTKTALKL